MAEYITALTDPFKVYIVSKDESRSQQYGNPLQGVNTNDQIYIHILHWVFEKGKFISGVPQYVFRWFWKEDVTFFVLKLCEFKQYS